MHIKKILFVMSFLYNFCHAGFALPEFLRTQDSPKKSAFYKLGVSGALLSASIINYDSMPVGLAQTGFGLSGTFIGLWGALQLFVALEGDEETQKLMQSQTHTYNRVIHNLAHDDRFLAGAAFSLGGLALALASQNESPSSLACTVLGMALMGWAASEPVKKEIKNFMNT